MNLQSFETCPTSKCALSYAIYLSIRLPKFPSYSPKDVLNSTSILSHLVCSKFNSHVYKLKRYSKLGHICFYFAPGVQRVASIEKCPMFQKKLVVGQSMWLLHPKKKKEMKCVRDPWTHMNHTFCWVLSALPTKARILCLDLV